MKRTLGLAILLFVILLCGGVNEVNGEVCSKQISAGTDVCTIEICTRLCKQEIKGGLQVEDQCIESDTCNCIYRCLS
ncbi:hypothetical protein CASFOL_024064 [Castilleja foliolosa]|uniref:Uncharacterized protein n=1 Tax=Castilleja foliolosa TaxID=1961234 RepID=A0ABD3CM88_9LAMI